MGRDAVGIGRGSGIVGEGQRRARPIAAGLDVEDCGRAAAGLLGRLLGDDLVAAYLVGSGALGGVAPGQSDVDVVAVCVTAPPAERTQAIVAGLGELAMTWPLRGLELVLYTRAAVAAPDRSPRFVLNLNVGPRMPYRVSLDPADEPAHWFLLDLAILRDHGRTLSGPSARDLVGPIPRSWLLEAVRDSLAWHDAHEGALQQTVLNASRGWRFAEEGVWSSKDDAGAWALARADDGAIVETALALRDGDRSRHLDPASVRAFQRRVRERVDGALAWPDEDPLVTGSSPISTPTTRRRPGSPPGPGSCPPPTRSTAGRSGASPARGERPSGWSGYTSGMEPRMYHDLAPWWPLLSAPSEYAEEAEIYRRLLVEAGDRPPVTVLELGSGGGNNASHLKAHFELTLVDLSAGMLEVSREANPECEHVQGDMRTVRLGREFDAVFVHDAVMYMTTAEDLRLAIETAFVHCRPGGAALFAPDHLREHFRTGTDHGGHDGDQRAVRFLEWTWDPDPLDTTYTVDYAYLLRDADGSVRVEHDRHVEGLFPRATWLELLADAGFEARAVPVEHSELEPGGYELFVATRPNGATPG
jgi:SAM-dependent methyltransferase